MPNYVVMEMAEKYDDEVYSVLDSGTPIQVYTDRAKADAERNKLQFEKLVEAFVRHLEAS